MNQKKINTESDGFKPAVFLDRDGTIIEDLGYLSHPSQVVFFKDTVSSLRRLSDHFSLFIVTNQSGVAKGEISMKDAERVNDYIGSYLAEHGVQIVATYTCPHECASGCRCIKPNSYFLKEAERDFNIDLGRSFTVGDHPHDVHFGTRVGATGIYVLSGHGMKHREGIPANTIIADGIGDATEIILMGRLQSGLG